MCAMQHESDSSVLELGNDMTMMQLKRHLGMDVSIAGNDWKVMSVRIDGRPKLELVLTDKEFEKKAREYFDKRQKVFGVGEAEVG